MSTTMSVREVRHRHWLREQQRHHQIEAQIRHVDVDVDVEICGSAYALHMSMSLRHVLRAEQKLARLDERMATWSSTTLRTCSCALVHVRWKPKRRDPQPIQKHVACTIEAAVRGALHTHHCAAKPCAQSSPHTQTSSHRPHVACLRPP